VALRSHELPVVCTNQKQSRVDCSEFNSHSVNRYLSPIDYSSVLNFFVYIFIYVFYCSGLLYPNPDIKN